ncbi:MAG TPA: hypothetical protein PKD37_05805 [Oligoflexia bacterium]|nr:hypothetical protein [Oligoflexia bacterium]HMP27477.1 hypothetical protein [Oligoflexia bacterium]
MRQILKIALFSGIIMVFSGCFLAPTISAVKELGLSPADRQAALQKQLKEFNDLRYWGNKTTLSGLVLPEEKNRLLPNLIVSSETRRLLEGKVDFLDFSPDSRQAFVRAKIKYYDVPVFIVQDRYETQEWVFSLSDGWLLKDIKETTASNA